MLLRRIVPLVSLAVVAAMFAGTSSAQARTVVCEFEGSATLEPDIPDINVDPSLDFEQGEYVFTSA